MQMKNTRKQTTHNVSIWLINLIDGNNNGNYKIHIIHNTSVYITFIYQLTKSYLILELWQLNMNCHVRPCEASTRLARKVPREIGVLGRDRSIYVDCGVFAKVGTFVGGGCLYEGNYDAGIFVKRAAFIPSVYCR